MMTFECLSVGDCVHRSRSVLANLNLCRGGTWPVGKKELEKLANRSLEI